MANSVIKANIGAVLNSYEGDIVTIKSPIERPFIMNMTVDITPIQDLHGYDKPWAGGNGKNLLPIPSSGATSSTITWTVVKDTDNNPIGISPSGTGNGNASNWAIGVVLPAGNYIYTSGLTESRDVTIDSFLQLNGVTIARGNNSDAPGNSFTLSTDSTLESLRLVFRVSSGYVVPANTVFKPMIRLASETDASFEPYSNICPISGWDDATIYVSPTEDEEDATTYVIDLDGTRYGGTLDVTSGVMVVTHAHLTLDENTSYTKGTASGLTYFHTTLPFTSKNTIAGTESNYYSDSFRMITSVALGNSYVTYNGTLLVVIIDQSITTTAGAQSYFGSNNANFVLPLATPLEVDLTPQQIEALEGQNNVWCSTGQTKLTALEMESIS